MLKTFLGVGFMKPRLVAVSISLVAIFALGMVGDVMAKSPPVEMLTQIEGTVEYATGTEWKKVNRSKFLFEGNKIRTGADGSASLVNQQTNTSRKLDPSSEIEITPKGAKLVSGNLSEAKPAAAGSLVDSLNQRFAKAQRYTTVRRSVSTKQKKAKLTTVKDITLCEAHPDLVWENMGPEYSYRLYIDDKSVDVPSAQEDMVRYKFPTLTPGDHEYRVDLVQNGQVVFETKKNNTIKWLGGPSLAEFEKGLAKIKASNPGDAILLASYLEDQGMIVAAMDVYRQYFKENADDVDMYPLLIKAYHDLKLKTLNMAEAVRYNQMVGSSEGK